MFVASNIYVYMESTVIARKAIFGMHGQRFDGTRLFDAILNI